MTVMPDLRGSDARVPTWLPRLLGFFIAVGPAATDMYLPAFPAVEASFGTEPGTAQLTLAAWFAGLAVGQAMAEAVASGLCGIDAEKRALKRCEFAQGFHGRH